jgi:WD40 repeat protein
MGLMRLRGFLLVLVGLVVLGAPAGAIAEEGCPNEAVRVAESAAHPEGFASGLPDCRAYEQVTPVDKDGTNPEGFINAVQASPSGDGIVFVVAANMPGGSAGDHPPVFLGSRGGEGWSDRGLQAPRGPHGYSYVRGWSEDLSEAVVESSEELTSGVSGPAFYLRDSATGSFQLAMLSPGEAIYPAGFSADDSRMIFATRNQLVSNAAAGQLNLYEWHGGVVSLVGVLPDGSTPPGGSSAGADGSAEGEFYTESAISRDGSRVFFTAGGTEQIYVREGGTRTVSVGTGAFLAATPDGSRVFFQASGLGGDLVEFDVESEQTTDLTPGGGVEGLLGVSDDGSYVYYAANGGGLYVWHDGTVGFIATTNNEANWRRASKQVSGGSDHSKDFKVSRVSSDGRFLLFTGSDGQLERYDAVHGRLGCVSCAPDGAPPAAPTTLGIITTPSSFENYPAILLRNFSSDGSRVFFDSVAELLPQDTNGVEDVYEWEQQGVGSCQGSSATFSAASGGCLYLVSSGRSPQPSFFADASANGDSVFFFTFQPLVGQDVDGLVDVYDARVGGGLAAQNPPAPPAPCEGEGCLAGAGGAPVFGVPVSASFAGARNQTPPAAVVPASKPKAKAKVKHKVVKPRRKKKRGARKAGRGARGAGVRGAMRGGK